VPRPSNKDAITRAALECFAEKGYDATRIADIARRAEVSVAALYNHYRSVQDLARELYLTHFRAYATDLATIVDDPDSSPGPDRVRARARQVVRTTLARYRADPAAFTFVSLRVPTFLDDLPPDIPLPLTSIQRLVAQGQSAGQVRDGDPVLIAGMFIGALLRVFFLADFAHLHGFALTPQHDDTIEAACLAILRPDRSAE
jgi:AcrR family transcriptional regulator